MTFVGGSLEQFTKLLHRTSALGSRVFGGSSFSQSIRRTLTPQPGLDVFRRLLSQAAPMPPVAGRVVLVCGSLQPGGAERQVANTLTGLAGSGIESATLLCDFLHGGTKEKYDFYLPLARQSGAVVRTIRADWSGCAIDDLPRSLGNGVPELTANLLADIANLYREFRAIRPQIVHAWLDWSNVRAGLAAVLAGVPRIVLSGRNLSPRHFALNTEYYHPAYTALAERPAEQVVLLNNSRAGADDYAAWLSLTPQRVRVLRNGMLFRDDMRPASQELAALRAQWGIPAQAPVVGGMFRFSAEKRPLLWVHAAARMLQTIPDAHFLIFGEGAMRPSIEKTVRALGIEARTRLPGVVDPSFPALAACDLILLTSSGEGTPNVLLEAQWLGVPVVCTDVGGAAEAVNDGVTGRVLKTEDPNTIAMAMAQILNDASFRAAAQREGPSFIAKRFGMKRMISETLATYRPN